MDKIPKNTQKLTLILISSLLFLLVNLAWFGTTSFWFSNVDLGYMNQYFGFMQSGTESKGIDLTQLIRGHMLIQYPVYKIFEFNPFPYFLVANIVHALTVVCFFFVSRNLLKSTAISFLLSLMFGINIAYSNVYFEGSFNGYYPLILLCILLSIIVIQKFNSIFLITLFNSALLIISLLFRESGILVILVSSFYLFLLKSFYLKNKVIYTGLLTLVFLLYLFIRNYLLGVLSSDLTDDAVQVRTALLSSGRYLEYIYLVILNGVRITTEQLIPYPFLYSFRDSLAGEMILSSLFKSHLTSAYLLTIGGLLIAFVLKILVHFYKSNKREANLNRLIIFAFLSWLGINFFMSFVLPFPEEVLSRSYSYGTVLSRYNYYGFPFLVLLIGSIFVIYKKNIKPKAFSLNYVTLSLVVVYMLLQIKFINTGTTYLLHSKHQQANYFFSSIYQSYPKFHEKSYIYYNFFQVDNLRDYVYDLTTIFGPKKYSNSKFTVHSSLSALQEIIKKENINVSQLYAFDLDNQGFFIDKTKLLRTAIFNESKQNINSDEIIIDQTKNIVTFPLNDKPYANFMHTLSFKMKGNLADGVDNCLARPAVGLNEYNSFILYNREIINSDYSRVLTTSDYGRGDPRFLFYNPLKLIDKQIGSSSVWKSEISDLKPEIILEFANIRMVNGIGLIFTPNRGIPLDFKVYSSVDGTSWDDALEVKNNKKSSRLDKFQSTREAKYVKLLITSTLSGQQPQIQELEVLNYPVSYFSQYGSLSELKDINFESFCVNQLDKGALLNWQWGYVAWKTNFGTEEKYYLPIYFDNFIHEYKIPIVNLEIYSKSKEILEEKIENLNLYLGNSKVNVDIQDVQFTRE